MELREYATILMKNWVLIVIASILELQRALVFPSSYTGVSVTYSVVCIGAVGGWDNL